MGDPYNPYNTPPYNRKQNEAIGHALLAFGIVLLLILSIIITWIIVCCERFRRKRKYRPGQQSLHQDQLGLSGRIIRSGPSPQINRHLLVPKNRSQHLVIANKAFLSKSTPQLLDQEDDAWRLEGMTTPCPSEPLISPDSSSPYRRPLVVSRNFLDARPSTSASAGLFPRTRSEPVLGPEKEFRWSLDGLNIHDQIKAILGTFPALDFMSFLTPTRSKSKAVKAKKLVNEKDEGPESSVDEILAIDLEISTPLTRGEQNSPRPTALRFQPSVHSSSPKKKKVETRYDFDIEKGPEQEEDKDLPPLLETTL